MHEGSVFTLIINVVLRATSYKSQTYLATTSPSRRHHDATTSLPRRHHDATINVLATSEAEITLLSDLLHVPVRAELKQVNIFNFSQISNNVLFLRYKKTNPDFV
ncbi:hypothetical protein PoB_005468600 [Plakobranchus ocellatus]|uniref:Uncharacterized protein n=1 Tax=Plakobranchus ocellatus TaxID=259542 RepID=A0AAV4BYF6_9GAST|nr:hypothetical protein PoB_005468600 [Plakobranchus ocellatus]